jgi:O-antigen/teichoic acid export membrane protein
MSSETRPSLFYRVLRWSERYTKTDMTYLAKSGGWLVTGQVVLMGVSLAVAIVFGHFVSTDAYGNYKYALTLASILGVLSLSGLATSVTQSAAKGYEGALAQGFSLNMRSSLLLAAAALAGALWSFLAGNNFVAASLVIIAVFAPLLNSFTLYSSYLIGLKDFKQDTIYNIIDGALPALFLIGVIFFTRRAIILVLVYFVANMAVTAFFYFRSLRLAKNNKHDPELLVYSTHLSVMNIIDTVADKIDSISVFMLLGPAPLAIYSFAIAIPEQIKALIKMMGPLSIAKFAERSMAEIDKTIWRRILVFALGFGICVVVYILLAPLIFRILFPIYIPSTGYSQLYALSMIFAAVGIPFGTIFQAHKKTKELYITSLVSQLLLIVFLPILTFEYGILGTILSQLLYRGIGMVIAIWQFFAIKRSAA